MMRFKLTFNFVFLLCFSCLAQNAFSSQTRWIGISPLRHKGEDYRIAKFREQRRFNAVEGSEVGQSAWDSQVKIEEFKPNVTVSLPNLGELQKLFERIRDERVWYWSEMEKFPRRIPWLYPADGCFLRADLM